MTDETTRQMTRRFLASDQIWPSAINARYPGSRFVARARLQTGERSVAPIFAASVTGELWGVLIETDDLASGEQVTVTTDFGDQMSASLEGGSLLSGDPQVVYMASRYWELPPAYIQQLREALLQQGLDTADEEPRDDGALGQSGSPQG